MTTPAPVDEEDAGDDSMIFATHMPGASVPPRPTDEFQHDEELQRLRDKLHGKAEDEGGDAEGSDSKATPAEEQRPASGPKRGGGPDSGPASGPKRGRGPDSGPASGGQRGGGPDSGPASRPLENNPHGGTGAITQKIFDGAGAGRGALARTREASRRSSDIGVIPPEVTGVVRPETPGFTSLVPGALVRPLHKGSILSILGGAAMLAVAALLLELSPLLGIVGLVVAGVELLALRVKYVRDAAHAHDDLRWPEWSEVFAAVPTYAALLLLVAPAAIAGGLAFGSPTWDASTPGSVWDRVDRLWNPARAAAEGAALPGESEGSDELLPEADMGRNGLTMLEALVGFPDVYDEQRPAERIARDVWEATNQRARQLVAPEDPTPAGIVGRVVLAVALLLWPMALLAAAKLKSAYAALHAPMLVRSILRAPAAYGVVLVTFLVQGAFILWLLTGLQVILRARLAAVPAHLLAVVLSSLLAISAMVVTGALLGRFYRSHAYELAWE